MKRKFQILKNPFKLCLVISRYLRGKGNTKPTLPPTFICLVTDVQLLIYKRGLLSSNLFTPNLAIPV